jgi:hypothetical protein
MAERGDVEGLQLALDAGADVESRSEYGTTALHKVFNFCPDYVIHLDQCFRHALRAK